MEIINDNYSELFLACRSGDIEVVEEILKKSVININVIHPDVGDTPLIFAVRNGNLNVVKRILQHPHVDVNAPGTRGLTPLMWSIFCLGSIDNEDYGQYFNIVRKLLEVPLLQLGKSCLLGSTVLHYVCHGNLNPFVSWWTPPCLSRYLKTIFTDTPDLGVFQYRSKLS